jgi:hypothetical protein
MPNGKPEMQAIGLKPPSELPPAAERGILTAWLAARGVLPANIPVITGKNRGQIVADLVQMCRKAKKATGRG